MPNAVPPLATANVPVETLPALRLPKSAPLPLKTFADNLPVEGLKMSFVEETDVVVREPDVDVVNTGKKLFLG